MDLLNWLTIEEALDGLKAQKFSAVDLTTACLNRIKSVNKEVNAVVQLDETALAQAEASDARIKAGTMGPLEGIPMIIKDNIQSVGTRTTAGSKILANYESPFDATVTKKLRVAGAIILGKANMDEFAMGSSTETSIYGATRNPWNLAKIPGGSSGGSIAAVAAGMCLAALGSDTGGSVRQPAALCGITGFKPTYGRVSRYGLLSMASSLDQISPCARTVADTRRVLRVIEGEDGMDSTSASKARYIPKAPESLKGVRIGVPKEFFMTGMDADVSVEVGKAIQKFESLGAEIVELSIPSFDYALAVYYVLMPCEVSANLARYDGQRFGYSAPANTLAESYQRTRGEGFGPEVRRRVMLGTYALSSGYYDAYYLQAQKARTVMKQEFEKALEGVDVLLSPTSPTVAWNVGEKFDDPLAMYLTDIYTVSVNVVGVPAISIPCGTAHDLPVGVQLIGRHFEDDRVMRIAELFQEASDFHVKRPML